MDRRRLLIGGAALAGLARGAWAAGPVDDLRAAAREGFVYGLPVAEMARLRAAAIGLKPGRGTPGFNAFAHRRSLAGAADPDLSAPDADFLTSSAWICLPPEGAKIVLPATGGRYVCVGFFDMYGNAFQVVEGRQLAERGRSFTLVGPPARVGMAGYSAPLPRMPHLMGDVIRSPGNWVWALARIHVESERDLPGAQAIQDGLEVRVKPTTARPMPAVSPEAAWGDYFFYVQKLIEESPPPADEMGFFRRIAPLQLGAGGEFEKARFADVDEGAINTGVAEGRTLAFQSRAPDAASLGWMWPKSAVGAYGQEFLYRARTVLAESAALPRETAMAIRAVAPDGALSFPSSDRYRLTLPGAPPCAGPWSLTLYETGRDGHLRLSQNPVGRHFVGGWTPGLKRRADGAIDILISRDAPPGGNWLPAPAAGAFALVLRAYAPGDALLERRYRLPPVEAVAGPADRPRH